MLTRARAHLTHSIFNRHYTPLSVGAAAAAVAALIVIRRKEKISLNRDSHEKFETKSESDERRPDNCVVNFSIAPVSHEMYNCLDWRQYSTNDENKREIITLLLVAQITHIFLSRLFSISPLFLRTFT